MKTLQNKFFLFLVLALSSPYWASAQCAMCKAALITGEDQSAAEGVNHGITYLMVFPYVLVGILGVAVYRIIKKESTPE